MGAPVQIFSRLSQLRDITSIGRSTTVWVAPNGSDSTGTRARQDKPFLTPAAAKAAGTAGDLVFVARGAYTCSASLAKHLLNWHFEPGCTVTFADDVSTAGIWDDGGSAMTFSVTGHGTFTRSTTNESLAFYVVRCSHASSSVYIAGESLVCTAGEEAASNGILCAAGTLDADFRTISSTGGNTYTVWWTNGTMRVRAKRITTDYVACGAEVTATPTGDAHVFAEEIYGLIIGGGNATDTAAAMWVRANIVKSSSGSAVASQGKNRIYVEAQKLFGSIQCSDGLLYVRADKASAISGGAESSPSLLYLQGGVSRIEVNHLDPVTFTGEMMKATGGTHQLNGMDYVGGASANGLEITGGTLRVGPLRINTSAASGKNPITKSGGTLILNGTVLIAEGTRDSITAGSAQGVVITGTASANKTINSNVSLTGGGALIVDSTLT